MHKFFVNPSSISGDIVTIGGEDVKHIYKVLRLKVGEIININNCEGLEYTAKLISIDKNEAKAEIIESIDKNNDDVLQYVMLVGERFNKASMDRSAFSISTIRDAGIKTQELA